LSVNFFEANNVQNRPVPKPIQKIGLPLGGGSTDLALRQMRGMIEGGRFGNESRLPPERELAAELRVGRSTLRKALEVLEAEGQIWRHVGQGTFIGRRSSKGSAKPFLDLASVSPKELLDARLSLEPAIAASAAVAARPSDIERMKLCAERRETTKQPEAYNLWDHQFHLAIAEATQNPILIGLIQQLNGLRRAPTWSSYKKGRMVEPYYSISKRQHRDIIAAIEQHDAGAAFRTMRDHIMGVQDGFFAWSDDTNQTLK
jgi:DNA-binding FadR family transcriptional regulator